jgi:hypothetical protein
MSWGRGLLRVWLVLSAIWLVFVSIASDDTPHVLGTAPVYVLAPPLSDDPSKLSTEELERIAKLPPGYVVDDWVPVNPPKADTNTNYRLEAALSLAQQALLPPLAVLLLGGGFYWAILGFKRRPDSA